MSLEHILLGMLQRPAAGYDLKAEFNEGARFFWSAELGQIYPALAAMERKGWLASRREPSDKGPARRVYRRTPAGRRELVRWMSGEPIVGAERFAYVAQLIYHGELRDLDRTLRFVQQLRASQAALQAYLQAGLDGLAGQFPGGVDELPDEEFHVWLCLQLGSRAIGARVEWCDEAVEIIRRRATRRQRAKPKEPTHD